MELFVADLVERFYTALWPFLRIGAMLIAVPILSIDAVTVRIRVFLTLLLTLLIYPLVDWPIIDPVSAEGLSEIFNQILIGLVMGFLLNRVCGCRSWWPGDLEFHGSCDGYHGRSRHG